MGSPGRYAILAESLARGLCARFGSGCFSGRLLCLGYCEICRASPLRCCGLERTTQIPCPNFRRLHLEHESLTATASNAGKWSLTMYKIVGGDWKPLAAYTELAEALGPQATAQTSAGSVPLPVSPVAWSAEILARDTD